MFKLNKMYFAFGLITSGAVIGTLAAAAMIFGNQGPVVLGFGFVALVAVMLGSVLALSSLLDQTAQPVVETLQDGLGDDIENLQQGVVTWPVWQFILTLAAIIVYFALLLRYHKFEAVWWGWMPVWMLSAAGAFLLVVIVARTEWFQDQQFETPGWVFVVAIVGFALALYLGISRTEDVRLMNPTYGADSQSYNYYHSNYYFFGDRSSSSVSSVHFDASECHGKGCEGYGYLILLIIFIILVLILILGSAFIANFWVFAGGVFIAMMILLTWQALMQRPYSYRRRSRMGY